MGTLIHCRFLLKNLTFHGQEAPSLHRSLACQPQLFLHSMSFLYQLHFFCVLTVQFAPKAELLVHLDPKLHLSIISTDLAPSISAANKTGPLPPPFGTWHPHMATAMFYSPSTSLATLRTIQTNNFCLSSDIMIFV